MFLVCFVQFQRAIIRTMPHLCTSHRSNSHYIYEALAVKLHFSIAFNIFLFASRSRSLVRVSTNGTLTALLSLGVLYVRDWYAPQHLQHRTERKEIHSKLTVRTSPHRHRDGHGRKQKHQTQARKIQFKNSNWNEMCVNVNVERLLWVQARSNNKPKTNSKQNWCTRSQNHNIQHTNTRIEWRITKLNCV